MDSNTSLWNPTNNTSGSGPVPNAGLPQKSSMTTGDIVYTAFFGILAVMIVFANSLMIGAFYVNRRLQTRTNYLLMSLAVADILVGAIALPFWLYISITYTFLGPVFKFYFVIDVTVIVSSVLNFTAISVERCYALVRPIKHRNIRKRVFVAVILLSWIFATLSGTLKEFLEMKINGIISSVIFFVPLTIILGAYGTIFYVARTHARGREVGSFKKVLRIAMTVAVVTGLFVICWTPSIVLDFSFSMCSMTNWVSAGCQGIMKMPPVILKISKWLWYVNSVCNPIVYGLRNEEFRRTFRKILLGLCCKKVRITEYDKNLHGGVRKGRSARRQREPCCESVQLQSVMVSPSPQQPSRLFDIRKNHCEAIQSSNPIKLEILTTNDLMDGLQELNKDLVSHTSPSDLISSSSPLTSTFAVAAPSTQLCNPAFEHDQTETGMSMYPGKEAIPKQDSKTENCTRLHERSPEVSVHNYMYDSHLHFTRSKNLGNDQNSKAICNLAPFDRKRSLSKIFIRPSINETALDGLKHVKLKLRSQSFP